MKRDRSLAAFIREHAAIIDAAIKRAAPHQPCTYNERRLWVLNDEGLYLMAKRWGWRG